MFNSFIKADNWVSSIEVILMLNQCKVVQAGMGHDDPKALHCPIGVLRFLLSDEIKIFTKEQVLNNLVLDINHIEYILKFKPTLLKLDTSLEPLVQCALINGRMDILSSLLNQIPLPNLKRMRKLLNYTLITFGNSEAIKMFAKKGLIPKKSIIELLARRGDCGLLDIVMANMPSLFNKQLNNGADGPITVIPFSVVVEQAIKWGQVDMVKHIYSHKGSKIHLIKHHSTAVSLGHVELLAYLWEVEPVENYEEVEELFNKAINTGQIGSLVWLLNHVDDDTSAQLMAGPINIKEAIGNNDIPMLRHLIDNGGVLDLRSIHNLKTYQSNPGIQSFIAQYKDQRAQQNNTLKRRSSSSNPRPSKQSRKK
ncbi:hypothetical protein SAMD00019534_032560 [Acytostelium subglobosum LB1]|uniref:hypothetical protein n=1 Tax=Acytostelium subglobosum LB1 TaxID=1410327 RepID=UPI000644B77E|nr:hypothetical protein SAMD00019534_032560 [Acytostelium subglobosum LB1]GAM20081.1 hypothetical protein SAMD00019534_032560 [Acytostelium subglobosum LB1]|eukprot:XP_012756843.1 hypothetical protein SAMD00019534_032560 [Acytostelium subglobosum LB1]